MTYEQAREEIANIIFRDRNLDLVSKANTPLAEEILSKLYTSAEIEDWKAGKCEPCMKYYKQSEPVKDNPLLSPVVEVIGTDLSGNHLIRKPTSSR